MLTKHEHLNDVPVLLINHLSTNICFLQSTFYPVVFVRGPLFTNLIGLFVSVYPHLDLVNSRVNFRNEKTVYGTQVLWSKLGQCYFFNAECHPNNLSHSSLNWQASQFCCALSPNYQQVHGHFPIYRRKIAENTMIRRDQDHGSDRHKSELLVRDTNYYVNNQKGERRLRCCRV